MMPRGSLASTPSYLQMMSIAVELRLDPVTVRGILNGMWEGHFRSSSEKPQAKGRILLHVLLSAIAVRISGSQSGFLQLHVTCLFYFESWAPLSDLWTQMRSGHVIRSDIIG